LLQLLKHDLAIVETGEGMQIDWSEHPSNADSPRIETRQPDLNLKIESVRQCLKQDLKIVSIDEGMQIDVDWSDEQPSNADRPRIETLQFVANLTDRTESQWLKHPIEMTSISLRIVTSLPFPRYRTRQVLRKSLRKSPQTPKNRFIGSMTTFLIPERASDKPVTWRSLAGMQIDWSAEQLANASAKTYSPRLESWQPGPKIKCERRLQSQKQDEQILLTDEGIQIDWRDAQPSNADCPRSDIWEPGSNVKLDSL
jgi:hypothetical protein